MVFRSAGSKVPVSGLYERMLYVSYLDSDTMVLRDIQGAPTVLRRGPAGVTATAAAVQEAPQALRCGIRAGLVYQPPLRAPGRWSLAAAPCRTCNPSSCIVPCLKARPSLWLDW